MNTDHDHGSGLTNFYRDVLIGAAFWTMVAFVLRGWLSTKSPTFVRRFKFFYILTLYCAIAVFLGFWAFVLFGPSNSNVPCEGLVYGSAAAEACWDQYVYGK